MVEEINASHSKSGVANEQKDKKKRSYVVNMVKVILVLSDLMIPCLLAGIVGYGIWSKQKVYELFVDGAVEGIKTVGKILPTLIALMVAVGILRASGFLDFLASLVGRLPIGKILPGELFPLILVRLFSSSAATGAALDLFKTYGTDSYLGMCTSLLLSSTETVFYTMSVYFLTAKVAKTRWTLPGALISTGAGVAASIILAGMISG